jgi:putative transposase
MQDVKSLTHSVWECKYHVVWIPKYRRKKLYGDLREYLGEIFHELARQKESKIVEGHLCPDHIHALIEIPPKYSVAQVVGYIKGKSAIAIARNYLGRKRDFTGQNFWAKGYYVSTVGRDEATIKKYIQEQEAEDKRLDQLELFKES